MDFWSYWKQLLGGGSTPKPIDYWKQLLGEGSTPKPIDYWKQLLGEGSTPKPIDNDEGVSANRIVDLIMKRALQFRRKKGMVIVIQNGRRVQIYFFNGHPKCTWDYTEGHFSTDQFGQQFFEGPPLEFILNEAEEPKLKLVLRHAFHDYDMSTQPLAKVIQRGWDYNFQMELHKYDCAIRISFDSNESEQEDFDSEQEEAVITVSKLMEHIIPRIRFMRGRNAQEIIGHPYFLGYMKGFAVNCVVVYSPRFNFDSQTLRLIAQKVVRLVFGNEGPAALTRMLELEEQQNSDFFKGAENGKITSDVLWDSWDKSLPVVNKACQQLDEDGIPPNDPEYKAKLLDTLHQLLLFDYFKPEELKRL